MDAAKAFYVDQAGFAADYEMAPNENFCIVQLTPPGSATSIAIGINLTNTPVAPGSTQGLRLVDDDIDQAKDELSSRGVNVTAVDDRPWGRFAWFSDPDGNGWGAQRGPARLNLVGARPRPACEHGAGVTVGGYLTVVTKKSNARWTALFNWWCRLMLTSVLPASALPSEIVLVKLNLMEFSPLPRGCRGTP